MALGVPPGQAAWLGQCEAPAGRRRLRYGYQRPTDMKPCSVGLFFVVLQHLNDVTGSDSPQGGKLEGGSSWSDKTAGPQQELGSDGQRLSRRRSSGKVRATVQRRCCPHEDGLGVTPCPAGLAAKRIQMYPRGLPRQPRCLLQLSAMAAGPGSASFPLQGPRPQISPSFGIRELTAGWAAGANAASPSERCCGSQGLGLCLLGITGMRRCARGWPGVQAAGG